MVHNYWQRQDIKGAVGAMEKMSDHAVSAIYLLLLHSELVLTSELNSYHFGVVHCAGYC